MFGASVSGTLSIRPRGTCSQDRSCLLILTTPSSPRGGVLAWGLTFCICEMGVKYCPPPSVVVRAKSQFPFRESIQCSYLLLLLLAPLFSHTLHLLTSCSYKWNHAICHLLCLAYFTEHNVSVLHSFLWPNNVGLCGYHISFTLSTVDGFGVCFYFLVTLNNSAMNVHIQVFMLTYCSFLLGIYLGVVFLGYVVIRCTTY